MGWDGRKKRQQPGGGSWDSWYGGQPYWQKDKPPANPGQGTKKVLAPYDQQQVGALASNAASLHAGSGLPASGVPDNLVRDLQSCVNGARKAESKVKKLVADRAKRIAQWDAYQAEVRSAFLAERKRHSQDLHT